MLTLSATVTFSDLSGQLSKELNTPTERMTIKHGFPPKLLHAPAAGTSDVLPIQHGERITVDIASNTSSSAPETRHPDNAWPATTESSGGSSNSWSLFNPEATSFTDQSLLEMLQRIQNDGWLKHSTSSHCLSTEY